MHQDPTCPRCGSELKAPGLWSSVWSCSRHGAVDPYTVLQHTGPDAVAHVVKRSGVPVWMACGLPGWVSSGFGYVGDERVKARATVTCLSGPSPLGGPADLIVVAEEPGVGLGARHAGLTQADPGDGFDSGAAHAKVIAADYPTALWNVAGARDRAVFVGEAQGLWLWAVVWPETAGVLMYDGVTLVDLRDPPVEVDIVHGTPSPRLSARVD